MSIFQLVVQAAINLISASLILASSFLIIIKLLEEQFFLNLAPEYVIAVAQTYISVADRFEI